MQNPRLKALDELASELERFELDLNQYYGDLEPQGVYDTLLTGKLGALARLCGTFGWSELAQQLTDELPLRCTAVETMEIVRGYVLPEIRQLMEQFEADATASPVEWFWQLVHPRIKTITRARFEAGFTGDAVETAFKEINGVVKLTVKNCVGRELDGHGLMTTAFSPANPIIAFNSLATESDRNVQQGYMEIFAGAMTGIRNPKAHGNVNLSRKEALHLICLASLLMHKLDESTVLPTREPA
jgi:uncharacterized protein (TIGR02391 family)